MVRSHIAMGALAALLAFTAPHPALGQSMDVHELFEARCGRCHGHSGTFARKSLKRSDGRIVGQKSGEEVGAFLKSHFGNLTDDEIARVLEAFGRQLETGAIYERKCRDCHDRAAELARLKLRIDSEGQLQGRYTGRDIVAFMGRHGRLTEAEAAIITDMLAWQLEQGR